MDVASPMITASGRAHFRAHARARAGKLYSEASAKAAKGDSSVAVPRYAAVSERPQFSIAVIIAKLTVASSERVRICALAKKT